MKSKMFLLLPVLSALLSVSCTCTPDHPEEGTSCPPAECFSNPLRSSGSSPCLVAWNGRYYYTQSAFVHVSLYVSETIAGLKDATEHVVYSPKKTFYISGPTLYRLDGKWYIYYSSEGQDMSTRIIHVLENVSEDPLDGEFVHKAVIPTGDGKAIHPSVFTHSGRRYLLWSGLDESRAVSRASIRIAPLSSPWTLAARPVSILSPEYEWECQWVSGNGLMSRQVSYVTEAPQCIVSRDGSKLLLYYAASQTYTSYYCEGMAWADAASDPLRASSWHKLPEPVFASDAESGAYGAGHVSFFRDSRDSLYFLYQAYSQRELDKMDNRSPRMQQAGWDENGIPVLGTPLPADAPVEEPVILRENSN